MATLAEKNKERWDNCRIYAEKGPLFEKASQRIKAGEERYKAVEKLTGVPWWFVGVVHLRESNLNWQRSLAQGDPWNKKSTHAPVGRGPFKSWEEAAVDALTKCPPYAAKNTDWSVGGSLAMLEKYNGLGYSKKGIPSPYLWAGTNQYTKGKYVADYVFDPNHVDTQLGVAGILKFLGIFKTPSVPTMPTSETAVKGGIFAGLLAYVALAWNHIMDHWMIYGSALALIILATLIITTKNKNNV